MKVDSHNLRPEFINEWMRIKSEDLLGQYTSAVDTAASTEHLVTFAVDKMSHLAKRPDSSLATVFLLISELKDVSEAGRSFAMDCMVYCETEEGEGFSRALDDLRNEYEKLAPTLQVGASM